MISYNGKATRISHLHYWEMPHGIINNELQTDLHELLWSEPAFPVCENYHDIYTHLKVKKPNKALYNTFEFYDLSPDIKHVFAFFTIDSNDNYNTILSIGTLCRAKVWIDGKILLNTYVHGNDSEPILYAMHKGLHFVVVQLDNYHDSYILDHKPSFSMRISDLYDEITGIESQLFREYYHEEIICQCRLTTASFDCRHAEQFSFAIYPRDYINLPDKLMLTAEVYDMSGTKIDSFSVCTKQKITWNIPSGLRAESPVLRFIFTYSYLNCNKALEYCIQIDSLNFITEKLKRQAETMLTHSTNTDVKHNIIGRVYTMETLFKQSRQEKAVETVDINEYYRLYCETKQLLHFVQQKKELSEWIYKKRFYSFYFLSKLDQTYEMLNVSLPDHYNPMKSYPVIFALNYKRYSWTSKRIAKRKQKQYIFAEISCRGYSMGSYIGEAAFWEAAEHVCRLFNIDKDRISIFGISAGAFAALALAQSYPDYFASLCFTCGVTQPEGLVNLYNTSVYAISAENEVYNTVGFETIDGQLSKCCSDYQKTVVPLADDNTIYPIISSSFLHMWMVNHRKKHYPEKIMLYTERQRHNHNFWLEISVFGKEDIFSYAEVEYISPHTYNIQARNVKELIIESPDTEKRIYHITINNEEHEINTNSQFIKLRKENKSYQITSQKSAGKYPCQWVGTGILDIYYAPLTIHIPGFAQYDNTTQSVFYRLAEKFSVPNTMGFESGLYVKYPISTNTHFKEAINREQNLILISLAQNIEPGWTEFLNSREIHADMKGFTYNGRRYQTDYCMMFITSNPNYPSNNVLLVITNSLQQMEKNYFTRSFIVSTYANGQTQPYNNTALIYYNKKYYALRNWGDELLPVF